MNELDDPRNALADDPARWAAVDRYRIVGAPSDRVFGRIASLAARFLGASMGLVSVVDADSIWLVATHGIDDAPERIPRAQGPCGLTCDGTGPASSAAPDAGEGFFAVNGITFHAWAPIVTADGLHIGAVAALDADRHPATAEELGILEDLAAIVMEQFELRRSSLDAVYFERGLRGAAEDARDDARTDRDTALGERDTARADRDTARAARDTAQADRDTAQADRDTAQADRDTARAERDAIGEYATVLQRTLLPPSLPRIDGLSLVAHYHPASPREVGGDFYDVFAVGPGRWAFFIGDVQGHGVAAAAATSLIRYTLRSAALHYADPRRVLEELNAVLLREVVPRRFCTVLFGTLRRDYRGGGFQVNLVTGGHPPALLLDPARGIADPVRPDAGMLVGATPNATFGACGVRLQAGQTLLLYTDGLIEARRGPGGFDEEQLARFALGHAAPGADALVARLADFIPSLRPEDDVAVLALGMV